MLSAHNDLAAVLYGKDIVVYIAKVEFVVL